MAADAPWERALDAVADEIRSALQHEADAGDSAVAPPTASTMRVWMDALTGLLDERRRARDPEGVSEVLDGLAMFLGASADARWRQQRELASEDDRIYSTQRIATIVEALIDVASHEMVEDTVSHAISILASLLINATCEAEIDSVLDAVRGQLCESQLENAILQGDPVPAGAILDGSTWMACLLRFTLLFGTARHEKTHDSCRLATLRLLTGAGDAVDEWIDTTWETTWHRHRSARVKESLFGSREDCTASIRRIFEHGFSVGREEDLSPSPLTEAVAIMGLRDADKLFGLVHGVDVTFIKSGQVHPDWKDTYRHIRMEDVENALREGYSIGVRGMQTRSLPVFDLCDNLQKELGQHVNANLYWTPPGQQGFDLHIDDHCVFAIQLKGRKRWVLHEPQQILPHLYDDMASQLTSKPPQVHSEIILEEGDVLYVPRGVAHYADTKDIDEESIHLTIGVEIEAKHTNARILEKLERTQTPLKSVEGSARAKSRGLMAWHLQSEAALLHHVTSFVSSPQTDELQHSLGAIQVALSDERALFLSQRSLRARAMVTLHEAACGGCRSQKVIDTDIHQPT